MQQLSGQDASFIYSERSHAPTHITSIGIYDQSTAPGGRVTFKGILGELEPRLHMARAFRQKVVRVPNDLDHPWWVEDANFDLEYHVRHIALPEARRLASVLHPGRPAPRPSARPVAAAVGDVHRRGSRRRRGRAGRRVRGRAEDPPRRRRRQVRRRDVDRHAHPDPRAGRGAPARHAVATRSRPQRRSTCSGGPVSTRGRCRGAGFVSPPSSCRARLVPSGCSAVSASRPRRATPRPLGSTDRSARTVCWTPASSTSPTSSPCGRWSPAPPSTTWRWP